MSIDPEERTECDYCLAEIERSVACPRCSFMSDELKAGDVCPDCCEVESEPARMRIADWCDIRKCTHDDDDMRDHLY